MNTNSIPSDEVVQTAAVMLRKGKYHQAIAYLKKQKQLSPRAMDYLCDAYFQSRDWNRAYEIVRLLIDRGADTIYNRKLELKILTNWGRYKEALALIKDFLSDHGDDIEALSIAKIASYYLGDKEGAVCYGQKSLTLKDRSIKAPRSHMIRPNNMGSSIISFSVWGTNKAYLLGAAINIELAKKYFPDWLVRIYAASSVDSEMLDLYRRIGAEVVLADKEFPDVPTYFWRFLVVDDSDTKYFLCRDADCRLSKQEATLVTEWLSSKKRFHVVRDHVLHDDLMLAGMWGGVGTCDLKIRERISSFFKGTPTNKYGYDQIFLGKMIWPKVRQSVFVHDRFYWTPGVKSHKHKLDLDFRGHMNESLVTAEAANLGLIK